MDRRGDSELKEVGLEIDAKKNHSQRSSPVWSLYLRQNLEYQPLDALKVYDLLTLIAISLIYFSPFIYLFFILSQRMDYISVSVGRPPPSLRSQPFFLQRSKFRLGIPYIRDTYLTSCPLRIYISISKVPSLQLLLSLRVCIYGKIL